MFDFDNEIRKSSGAIGVYELPSDYPDFNFLSLDEEGIVTQLRRELLGQKDKVKEMILRETSSHSGSDFIKKLLFESDNKNFNLDLGDLVCLSRRSYHEIAKSIPNYPTSFPTEAGVVIGIKKINNLSDEELKEIGFNQSNIERVRTGDVISKDIHFILIKWIMDKSPLTIVIDSMIYKITTV